MSEIPTWQEQKEADNDFPATDSEYRDDEIQALRARCSELVSDRAAFENWAASELAAPISWQQRGTYEFAWRIWQAALQPQVATEPEYWEVTQNGRTFVLPAVEFAGKSYDCASFRALYTTPPPAAQEAIRLALEALPKLVGMLNDMNSAYGSEAVDAIVAEGKAAIAALEKELTP